MIQSKRKNAIKKSMIQELQILLNNMPEMKLLPGKYNISVHDNRFKIKLEIINNNGKK